MACNRDIFIIIHYRFRPNWPSSGVYSGRGTAARCNVLFDPIEKNTALQCAEVSLFEYTPEDCQLGRNM
jgi:hypothetical protein